MIKLSLSILISICSTNVFADVITDSAHFKFFKEKTAGDISAFVDTELINGMVCKGFLYPGLNLLGGELNASGSSIYFNVKNAEICNMQTFFEGVSFTELENHLTNELKTAASGLVGKRCSSDSAKTKTCAFVYKDKQLLESGLRGIIIIKDESNGLFATILGLGNSVESRTQNDLAALLLQKTINGYDQ